ncbi:MAG TPA: hypothetical protein VK638_58465 [Edaphobacter sp.]|nr:hypothetical protein [Edaphobacter sp.]
MELLTPDANQERPTFALARAMCQQVSLEIRPLVDPRLDSVLSQICETHVNGGALFASFSVGPSTAFDWFASRDRLLEFGILRQLLDRIEVNHALPDLEIEPSKPDDPAFVVHRLGEVVSSEQLAEIMNLEIPGNQFRRHGVDEKYEIGDAGYDGNFRLTSSFLFDGELAQKLYAGGAYTSAGARGDGRTEKENSLAFCEALFGLRLSEVSYYSTHNAWTRWFGGIAWDWTAILFDRRARALSILAVTDTD